MTENLPTRVDGYALSAIGVMSVEDMVKQVDKIQELMDKVMVEGEHYGIIPGCDKNSLYKSGAEKISWVFRLGPKYKIERENLSNFHREYEFVCELYNINTGAFQGEGVGTCSTMESKYRYREEKRVCPRCDEKTIIKGKEEFGGGWLCWKKNGGCGAKFKDGDESIEGQKVGRIENPDIADTYNTVKKMAKKRAFIDAVLTATAASDIFTQDVEDLPEETLNSRKEKNPKKKPEPGKKQYNIKDPNAPITEPQKKKIYAMCKSEGMSDREAKEFYHFVLGFDKDKITKGAAHEFIGSFIDKLKQWREQQDNSRPVGESGSGINSVDEQTSRESDTLIANENPEPDFNLVNLEKYARQAKYHVARQQMQSAESCVDDMLDGMNYDMEDDPANVRGNYEHEEWGVVAYGLLEFARTKAQRKIMEE